MLRWSRDYLTDAGLAALRAVFPSVIQHAQRADGGDPTDRYASFYE